MQALSRRRTREGCLDGYAKLKSSQDCSRDSWPPMNGDHLNNIFDPRLAISGTSDASDAANAVSAMSAMSSGVDRRAALLLTQVSLALAFLALLAHFHTPIGSSFLPSRPPRPVLALLPPSARRHTRAPTEYVLYRFIRTNPLLFQGSQGRTPPPFSPSNPHRRLCSLLPPHSMLSSLSRGRDQREAPSSSRSQRI